MGKFGIAVALLFSLILVQSSYAAGWSVKRTTSQLDGTQTSIASLYSSNRIPNSIGIPQHGALLVRCKGAQLDVYVIWPPFMGSEDTEVRWRFDAGEIMNESWTISDDGTATFARDPIAFLVGLRSAKRLVLSAAPYETTEQELIFDVSGSASVVSAAAKCGSPN